MRYTDRLRRTPDRLTSADWERLLTAAPAPKTVLAYCPCCGSTVAVELVATVLPVTSDPIPVTPVADDTGVEHAALTHADLVA